MFKNNIITKSKESNYLTGKAKRERLAELREKALKDRNSLYNYGYRKGLQEGFEQSFKASIEQGIQ